MNTAGSPRSRAILVSALAAVLIGAHSLEAATLTVTDLGDSGLPGQIRALIGAASPGDTIAIPPGTITLGRELLVDKDLTIRGAGPGLTAIDGGGVDRVFEVGTIATVATISDMTIRNGSSSAGGAILNNPSTLNFPGTLMLSKVTITGNRTSGLGGGINNFAGNMRLVGVTVSANTAAGDGGGIFNLGPLTLADVAIIGNSASSGGGLWSGSDARLTNVTISGNSASFNGGGLHTIGPMALINVTVSGNTVPGAFGATGLSLQALVSLKNTIVANSPAARNCAFFGPGAIVSGGHNLDSGPSCGLSGVGDLLDVDPKLGPLQNNGGLTATHALLPGSPAQDAGDNTGCPTIDQRGVGRPQGIACDIGAYEQALPSPSAALTAAVLPGSRSVQVGTPATAFASVINLGPGTATGCGLSLSTSLAADFVFQTTNPSTNAPTGMQNSPVDIPAGGLKAFVFSITPTDAFGPADVAVSFHCVDTTPAPSITGLDTLLLSASTSPVPDIVALAATPGGDGTVTLASTGVFVVAAVNVGVAGTITVAADTGDAALPVTFALCQTNPATSLCLVPPAERVTTAIGADATAAFGIFVTGSGAIPFAPAINRLFVRFRDDTGAVRGATSVAVRAP